MTERSPRTTCLYALATESPMIKMSEDRHNKIIKIMYADINIEEHVPMFDHLTTSEQG